MNALAFGLCVVSWNVCCSLGPVLQCVYSLGNRLAFGQCAAYLVMWCLSSVLQFGSCVGGGA